VANPWLGLVAFGKEGKRRLTIFRSMKKEIALDAVEKVSPPQWKVIFLAAVVLTSGRIHPMFLERSEALLQTIDVILN